MDISETKIDDSVLNSEIDIENYEIIRRDRNRHGAGVACYKKRYLFYKIKYIF